MRIITADQLADRQVCNHFLSLFRQLFGNSVEVTHELAEKHFNTFPISWLSTYMLSPKGRTAFDYVFYKADEELKKVTEVAYNTKVLGATSPKEIQQAYCDYERMMQPHLDKFYKVIAHAFVDLYNQETP